MLSLYLDKLSENHGENLFAWRLKNTTNRELFVYPQLTMSGTHITWVPAYNIGVKLDFVPIYFT